jgi:hypothetical protein
VETILKNEANIPVLTGEIDGQIYEPEPAAPEESDIPLNLGKQASA